MFLFRFCILAISLISAIESYGVTYYSNNAELSNVNNWWTNTNGSGSHPSNFTNSGDVFQVQALQTCSVNSNWTVGNGVNLDIYGTINISGSAIFTLGSSATTTIRLAVKNGGTFSNQTTGTVSLYGAVSIESGGTWTGSGTTDNAIKVYGSFTNSSTLQTDNSTSNYTFSNIGTYIFDGGTGMNVYKHSSTGLNTTFNGKWYVRNALSTIQFQMNANAEVYVLGTFTTSGDWSHCISTSTLHYAANIPLVATQYGCKVQIEKGISVTLSSGNFFNNTDFVLDSNSTVTVSGTGMLQYLHSITLNGGSKLYLNNGLLPNNFNGFTNVYSPTSTFEFGNNGSNYSLLIYADKQTFGNLILDNASSASTVNIYNTNATIQGDLTIGSNVTLQPWTGFQYDLILGGNVINNGSLTTSATTIKNVTFNGSSAQSIGGSSTTTFYNLIINNTSTTGVTLSKPTFVTNALTLSDGQIYSSSSNLLTLNSGTTSSTGTDASHVEGPIKKIGSTDFTFPTGKSGNVAQIAFTPSSGFDATTEISAEYFFTASPNSNNLGSGVHNVSKVEYWDITRVTDPGNDASCNVTMYINNKTRSAISGSGTDIITTHYESGAWTNKGGTFHDNGNGSGYITSITPLTSFSPETIASIDGSSVLPIELASFKASKNKENIELKWSTQTETINDNFNLYKSADGENWQSIYTCNGAGTSTVAHFYSFIDENAFEGFNYYCLKQSDFDGKCSFSQIESVNMKNEDVEFEIYPNLATSDEMTFHIKGNKMETAVITIYDLLGHDVCSGSVEISKSFVNVKLSDLCNVEAGTYFVYLVGKTICRNIKIIVH